MPIPLAWLQLKREPVRLFVALGGVAFAVILVFMQIGFSDSLYGSAVRMHQHLVADLVLISPRSLYLAAMKSFTRRRLYQALAFDGVEAVAPLYAGFTVWKTPYGGHMRTIFVSGVDPAMRAFDLPEVNAQLEKLHALDVVLFDRASRPEYGPVAQMVANGELVTTEVSDRRITVAGLFELGTTFGIDGTLITSDSTFLKLFPDHSRGMIEIGLIKLKPGADPERLRRVLVAGLAPDVEVLTKQAYMDREKNYWADTTPIGYVFAFGSIMGLIVGGVIVYQILFADIAAHLPQYATLKAMGYKNSYLFSVVFQEALILAVVGYLPGAVVALWLYRVTERATQLPLFMAWQTALAVLALTILMCTVAGTIALRKVRSADPAEIF